jgi:hypothetical protein
MDNDASSPGLPTSGPWSGYYAYSTSDIKHVMKLHLTFARDGGIDGDGIDDIALFEIRGVFGASTREVQWIKSYIGMHSVAYQGVYDGRNILGAWTVEGISGPFRIWPSALSENEEAEEKVEVEDEAELVMT